MHLYYFILSVLYFYSERSPLLQRNAARDFGGVSQIYIYIYKYMYVYIYIYIKKKKLYKAVF